VAATRRAAWQIYRVLIALVFAACIVQIFLAGRGVFGIRGAAKLDDQSSLDPHRALGDAISLVAILIFLCAVVMLNKRLMVWTLVLALLAAAVQTATAVPEHPWVAGLHPLSGVAILGISGYLAHSAWARKATPQPTG